MNTSQSGIPPGSQYSNIPPGAMEQRMMGSINARAPDQSFDEEVNPIQQELQNRFNPAGPPPGYGPNPNLPGHSQQFDMQRQQPMAPQLAPSPLNYDKIKRFLMESDEVLKICATLQAFRWRLTKTRKKKALK